MKKFYYLMFVYHRLKASYSSGEFILLKKSYITFGLIFSFLSKLITNFDLILKINILKSGKITTLLLKNYLGLKYKKSFVDYLFFNNELEITNIKLLKSPSVNNNDVISYCLFNETYLLKSQKRDNLNNVELINYLLLYKIRAEKFLSNLKYVFKSDENTILIFRIQNHHSLKVTPDFQTLINMLEEIDDFIIDSETYFYIETAHTKMYRDINYYLSQYYKILSLTTSIDYEFNDLIKKIFRITIWNISFNNLKFKMSHNDLNHSNIIFNYSNKSYKIIDWESMYFAPKYFDNAYFLSFFTLDEINDKLINFFSHINDDVLVFYWFTIYYSVINTMESSKFTKLNLKGLLNRINNEIKY